MRKFTHEDIDDKDRNILGYWMDMDSRLTRFGNSGNMGTFQLVFGKENGERLWMHYVTNCDRVFSRFITYLTTFEKEELLINVLKNNIMYAL